MQKYRIKVTYQDFSGGCFRADVSLHLPSSTAAGKLASDYLMPSEKVMERALDLNWGYRSDDYHGFVYRRIGLEGSTREALAEAISGAILEIEMNLHRIHGLIADLLKPIELAIDPLINPLSVQLPDRDKIDAFDRMCQEGQATSKTYFDRDPLELKLPFNHLALVGVFLCEGLTDGDVAFLDSCSWAYSAGEHEGWLIHIGDTATSVNMLISEDLSSAINWCFKEEIEWLRLTP